MITARLKFLGNTAARLFGLEKSIGQAAISSEILQAEEREEATTIYSPANEMERATCGVPGHSTLQEELAIATNAHAVHAPVIQYVLKNCLVHPFGVEYAGGQIRKYGRFKDRWATGEIHEIDKAAYCMSDVSHRYFGHWLLDACPTALLVQPGCETLLDVRDDWGHAKEYAKAFDLTPLPFKNVFVRELSVFQDYSQGSLKRARYEVLRKKVQKAFGQTQVSAQAVYLRRGNSGSARHISNEDELMDRLQAKGFTILDSVAASSTEIHRHLANATMVVSIDGSHMNHLYFSMRAGGKILMLIPSDRFTLTQAGYASANELHFGFTVAERTDTGYQVDIDRVFKTMDLMPA